jgi:hypothetical protein
MGGVLAAGLPGAIYARVREAYGDMSRLQQGLHDRGDELLSLRDKKFFAEASENISMALGDLKGWKHGS